MQYSIHCISYQIKILQSCMVFSLISSQQIKQRFSFLQLKYGDLYSVLDAVKVMILLAMILLLYARKIMSLTVCHNYGSMSVHLGLILSHWLWLYQRRQQLPHVRVSKTVWDSVFGILGTGFQSLSIKLGFLIPIIGIPYSLSCIPDSNSNDSDHPKQFCFSRFRIPQAKVSHIPESRFPYMGPQLRHIQS